MIIDQACWERGCPCHDSHEEGVEVVKREWVGLTNEQIFEHEWWDEETAFAVNKELKEKNT